METKGFFRFVIILTDRYFILVERNLLPQGVTHKSPKLVFTVIPSKYKTAKNIHFTLSEKEKLRLCNDYVSFFHTDICEQT